MPESEVVDTRPELVECSVCKKEIPASEAVSPEGRDYLLYFCGGECRAEWEKEEAERLERSFESRSGVKRG
jgi:YHS domain-containing protein